MPRPVQKGLTWTTFLGAPDSTLPGLVAAEVYFIFKVEGEIVCFPNPLQDLIVSYAFVYTVLQNGHWDRTETLASTGQVELCVLPAEAGGGMVWAGADPRAVVKGSACGKTRVCTDPRPPGKVGSRAHCKVPAASIKLLAS